MLFRSIEAANAVKARPFDLPIEVAKYWSRSEIVWAGPKDLPNSLGKLVAQLRGALEGDGLVLERRPFAAHITLIRKASQPPLLPPLPAVRWLARQFALVRSASGAYHTLAEFPLHA